MTATTPPDIGTDDDILTKLTFRLAVCQYKRHIKGKQLCQSATAAELMLHIMQCPDYAYTAVRATSTEAASMAILFWIRAAMVTHCVTTRPKQMEVVKLC